VSEDLMVTREGDMLVIRLALKTPTPSGWEDTRRGLDPREPKDRSPD
jgi:hypothetical protein